MAKVGNEERKPKKPKKIKPYRSHYERYRTWMNAITVAIQILVLLKVYGIV